MTDDVKTVVEVLKDWRSVHMDEHKNIWTRFSEIECDYRKTLEAIAILKTKMILYTSLAAFFASLLAGILSPLIWKMLR